MVVFRRAIRQDLRRLGARLGELACGGIGAARADAVCRYTAALLTAIRARQDGEDAILWLVTAAVAGQSVDLAPLSDDRQTIGAAAGNASTALGRLGAEPGALGELRASIVLLADMLDEHIADQEAQVVQAMRRYLTVGACLWCEKQIWRTAPLRDRQGRSNTEGEFRTNVITRGTEVTVNAFYKHSRIKQYLKNGHALRVETVVKAPGDLGCQRRLHNLGELQARARAVNARLLQTERAGQACVLANPVFERIAQPSVDADGRRATAMRFGDSRV